MNITRLFILRPIGTTLLAVGLLLAGIAAYRLLPVASLPNVEFPTINVFASRPGADPATMAATIAAPLERRLGEIAGVTELTSVNALGSTRIAIQFDLSRSADGAARDVQAALNAAAVDLPSDLPTLPGYRKVNPSAAPIIILALTSKTLPPSELYDAADTVIAQRILRVDGVADVNVGGAEQPAVRVRMNPARLATMGVSLDEVRAALTNANTVTPIGIIDGDKQAVAIETNAQLKTAADFQQLIVRASGGTVIRLKDVAEVVQATRNVRASGMYNKQPAVILFITKQGDANVIETVDRIKDLLPEIKRWVPAGIDISILTDRTTTIRASIVDMYKTLLISVVLVMAVVLLFLRRAAATFAAGVTVPLSLAGTAAAMWMAGYSINNLTLLALVVSVGFVVDDAIVMIENMFRNLEAGMRPITAAIEGARQIGFTIISISISLIAAFIPLLFLGGVPGRFLREFSVTLVFAIIVSTIVSLTVTPMICAHFVRAAPSRNARLIDRIMDGGLQRLTNFYAETLQVALRFRWLTMLVMLGTVALTVHLYIKIPKGLIPADDTGLVFGSMEASQDVSFETMAALQRQALDVVMADPAVDGVGSSVGAGGFSATQNSGRMFISLKSLADRGGVTTQMVVDRLRRGLARIEGLRTFVSASVDIRVGARSGKSQYQMTLWSSDIDELYSWVPKVVIAAKTVPGIVDVATDREQGGLQADVVIDRLVASRLGVKIQDIDTALNNAFAQRQVSLIYAPRNQYRVILEIDPKFQRDPSDLTRIYVTGADGAQIPLSSVARIETSLAPLVVNHQGPYPAVTISYDVAPSATLDKVQSGLRKVIADLRLPDSIRADAAGDAKVIQGQGAAQALLIAAALLTIYIVLGVLYESLAHPLTIISTLPAAGLGALLALKIWDMELSLIAFIGIILLIGIVKKNGIMLVDFALDAERTRGLTPAAAIYDACIERFRPILMTTLAALLGALPLAYATGPGSDVRRPLGVAIIGGLVISQILTLYTTPVIYLLLDRLHRRLWGHATPDTALVAKQSPSSTSSSTPGPTSSAQPIVQ
jgi:hydrophobe/amphiphile efflux-1 (HAE1) family protein